ncbi:hypothetical protein RUM43_002574 [Polyplax serrata]|uniref:Uncharacterized protein n=1 Tax=Polyplax serrata TaxID=468196 RepID=A0AAN8PZN6_POLSC
MASSQRQGITANSLLPCYFFHMLRYAILHRQKSRERKTRNIRQRVVEEFTIQKRLSESRLSPKSQSLFTVPAKLKLAFEERTLTQTCKQHPFMRRSPRALNRVSSALKLRTMLMVGKRSWKICSGRVWPLTPSQVEISLDEYVIIDSTRVFD